jgi:NADH:ubiquinone oxidoreductase subunit 2 (subunit N)
VLNSIVGLYYYLTVLKVVYLYRSEHDNEPIAVPRAYALALWACAVGVILIGTVAGPWLTWVTSAARGLF